MTRFWFRLYERGGVAQTNYDQYVDATNKTAARKEISRSYRADLPSNAKANGYTPWSEVRIQWGREEKRFGEE